MLKWLGINSTVNAFDIQEQIGSGGPGNLWKVFTATKKGSSTPLKNSLFMLDKRSLRLSKEDVSNLSQLLKKDAQTLSRLRHPSLLQVSESVDDSTGAIAFASEPLLCCLGNVLGNFENFDTCPSKADFRAKFDLDEVEIQKGILQVIKGLEFLHANNWTHVSLSPDSIYINAKGDWKIAGFAFAQFSNVGNSTFYLRDYPPFCSPTLDFMAPELVIDSRCVPASDLWSLACLIYSVFNNGSSPIAANDNLHTYNTICNRLETVNLSKNIPPQLTESLRRMLQKDPSTRMPLSEFESSSFFDNILVSTIGFLESFVEKNQISKAQFLKGLVAMLPQFSLKLVHRKTPFALPNIFWISEKGTDQDFMTKILPALKPVFKMNDPPQALLLLLSRMDIFLSKCSSSAETFKQDVMPLLYTALESRVPAVQEQAIKTVPTILPTLDFTATKSVLLPKISAIYSNGAVALSTRVACLIAVHGMIKVLDKFTIVEKVLPMLKANVVREPGLLVALLAVYEEASKGVEKEMVAAEVLPEIWRLALDPVLTVKQFKRFMKVIQDLSKRVEEQHTKFLEDVKSMDVPGGSGNAASAPSLNPSGSDFASLVSASKQSVKSPTTSQPTKVGATFSSSNDDGWQEFDAPNVSALHSGPTSTERIAPVKPAGKIPGYGNIASNSSLAAKKSSNALGFGATFPSIPALAPPPSHSNGASNFPVASFSNASSNNGTASWTATQNFGNATSTSSGWNSGFGNAAGQGNGLMTPMAFNHTSGIASGGQQWSGLKNAGSSATKKNQTLDEFDPFG
ncbi:kinase-like domain-containing protein [Chytriomyces cf. hyalinus JEL632]|nr:kinase-like domain-containing protein [Chytriomyces cf. hyalinus JEL632]